MGVWIDYLSLMLVNMSAGLVLLAVFLVRDLNGPRQHSWAAAFAAVGLVAFLPGLRITLTWPLPGIANIAFGELSVLFGVLYLAAALAMGRNWRMEPLGLLAILFSLPVILVGLRTADQFQHQPIPELGFLVTAAGGILTGLSLWLPNVKVLRWSAAVLLIVAAGIWALTAGGAFWGHLDGMKAWHPLIFQAK